MKKIIYYSFLLCILSALPINAQPIMSYDFESGQGAYQEMTTGNVVYSGVNSNLNNIAFDGFTSEGIKSLTTTAGFPIGFDFMFNDLPMNKFIIGSGGFLMLGKDNIKINPLRSAFLLSGGSDDIGEGKQNVIGVGVNTDFKGIASTEISYKLSGTSPNRVLTTQFKNLQLATDYWDGVAIISLQIRLYETSNKIEIIFKDWDTTTSTSPKVTRIGIKGNDGDIHSRCTINNDWNETEKSESTLSWGVSSFPADGLTYTFTPHVVCEKPTGQPTGLELTSGSTQIKGSFKEIPTADHYLVVMSETQNFNGNPADKTYYKAGDKIGNATIVTYNTSTSFETPENLTGSKNYYFRIYAVNSFCTLGPVYNTSDPLNGNIKTLPDTPQVIEAKEEGYDYINLSVTGNLYGDPIIIAMTDNTVGASEGFPTNEGIFGTPVGILNTGSQIEGGGKVVYKGNAGADIKIEELQSNMLYHFRTWSIDNENRYSSTSTTCNGITWGKLPYHADFGNMNMYEPPFGWETTGNTFRITKQNTNNGGEEFYQLECDIKNGDPTNGKENSTATQWVLLNNSTNRILFKYNITTWTRAAGYKPYIDWDERDVLDIQISKNGTDYTTIHTINKENVPKLATATDWGTFNFPFDNFKGEKVKIKLRWKTYSSLAIKLLVESFTIEEKPACEYPINLTVDQSSIVGSQASISWVGSEENAWDIRFRKAGDENWGAPIEVRSNPYLLTTLPASSGIELQVRAKCSLTSSSPWSKSLKFTSGYAIPFAENFNIGSALPNGWSFENGVLDSPTEFCTGSVMTCRKNWQFNQNSLRARYSAQLKDWALTPQIDMNDGSVHGKLEFDLSMVNVTQTPNPDDAYFAVVVSTDGGKTFNKENVVLELKKNDIDGINDGKHYSVDLSKFKGIVKLGFYAYTGSNGTGGQLVLDNIELKETCPPAINAIASEVTPATSTVTWEGEADEWLTFVRIAGETKRDYVKQAQAKLTLTDLTPKTNYEVGITKACTAGDTARVVIVTFTTQSLATCLEPEAVTATPSKKFVTINWSGEADRYNVRLRQVGTDEWIDKATQTNSIKVDGLETGTEYEYTLQSICSSAQGDISPWTETAKVTTLAVTCFQPTDITAEPTHKMAIISWEGEADNYELAYRTEGSWIVKSVKGGNSYIIDELSAATKYTLRLRSICAVGDTSEWSANTEFKTAAIPVCSLPTNLRVTGLTDNAVKFEWDADESNLNWDIHYRASSATQWITQLKLTEKSYQANDLTPNTAYLWSVKATCDEGRTSAWTGQGNFTTNPSGIGNIKTDDLTVYALNGVINILNPQNIKIDHILLFGTDGRAIKEYNISSDENVLIPVNLGISKVIVKVLGVNFTSSYTLIIK